MRLADIKAMAYEELEAKLLENRRALRAAKDLEEKRRLAREDHDLMLEMDRRWNEAERRRRGDEDGGGEPRPVP